MRSLAAVLRIEVRGSLVSRTRCTALLRCPAEPGPIIDIGESWTPGSAAHRHSASKTRVNALMALRSIRGTLS